MLGNDKPDVLVKIERLLWESLLAIATGKEHIYKAMNNFISKVDWEEIAMVSEGDRSHFADGMLLQPAHTFDQNLFIDDLQTNHCHWWTFTWFPLMGKLVYLNRGHWLTCDRGFEVGFV